MLQKGILKIQDKLGRFTLANIFFHIVDTKTILEMTLLISEHSCASSPAIQLASFLFSVLSHL